MATPEGKVKAIVKAMLKEVDAYQHWPVQTGYGAACLDCHGCYAGLYYAIETKAPGKHPTPRQLLTIEDIERRNGKVFVIGSYKQGDKIYPDGPTVEGKYSGLDELDEWLTINAP